jgi:hypothetical protein
MSNQSAINLFLILAIMSVTLFFQQTATLARLEQQPVFKMHEIQSLVINENQINSFEHSFWKAESEFRNAVDVKDKSDIVRRIINFISSPLSWFFQGLEIAVDSITSIEDEANDIIGEASKTINHEHNVIREAVVIIQEHKKALKNAEEQINVGQQQQIHHARSLRNIALLLFMFSLGSALFARPTRIEATQVDWLPAERPAALKQALGLSGLGGLFSSLPGLDGILFQLVLPSLCIGYFIIRRQLPVDHGDWEKVAVGGLGFGLVVSIAILTFYACFGLSIAFAVSGFLFGLFVAAAIQCVSLPLTTRQFFLVALIFGIARMVAALSAVFAGAELTVLEGIIGIVAVLWVIQTHASWVRLIRFDILLVWFAVYSIMAFGLGNYFDAGFPQLLTSYFTTALAGGGLLTYYLSQARTERELLPKPLNQKAPMILVSKKQLVSR